MMLWTGLGNAPMLQGTQAASTGRQQETQRVRDCDVEMVFNDHESK
jgi:hypothetical protein